MIGVWRRRHYGAGGGEIPTTWHVDLANAIGKTWSQKWVAMGIRTSASWAPQDIWLPDDGAGRRQSIASFVGGVTPGVAAPPGGIFGNWQYGQIAPALVPVNIPAALRPSGKVVMKVNGWWNAQPQLAQITLALGPSPGNHAEPVTITLQDAVSGTGGMQFAADGTLHDSLSVPAFPFYVSMDADLGANEVTFAATRDEAGTDVIAARGPYTIVSGTRPAGIAPSVYASVYPEGPAWAADVPGATVDIQNPIWPA